MIHDKCCFLLYADGKVQDQPMLSHNQIGSYTISAVDNNQLFIKSDSVAPDENVKMHGLS